MQWTRENSVNRPKEHISLIYTAMFARVVSSSTEVKFNEYKIILFTKNYCILMMNYKSWCVRTMQNNVNKTDCVKMIINIKYYKIYPYKKIYHLNYEYTTHCWDRMISKIRNITIGQTGITLDCTKKLLPQWQKFAAKQTIKNQVPPQHIGRVEAHKY